MKDPSPTPMPSLSVVICTRNRADKIGASVQAVLACDHDSFVVTVIDQSTDGSTEEVLGRIRDSRLRYLHSTQPGLSRAYNTGIANSPSPIIAFTDDDCIVPSDWIQRIEGAFASEPDGELLYGQVLAKDDDPEHRAHTPVLPFDRPERLSRRDGFRVFGMGANFAARRTLFDKIGGFDEILGGGGPLRSSQDFDLAYRAYRAGSVIILRPEVAVLHDGRRDPEDWPALFRNYGVGDGAFYLKHVRCGDPYAALLLGRRVVHESIRVVGRPLIGRDRREQYLAGFFLGMKESLKFQVDHRNKRYALTVRKGEP